MSEFEGDELVIDQVHLLHAVRGIFRPIIFLLRPNSVLVNIYTLINCVCLNNRCAVFRCRLKLAYTKGKETKIFGILCWDPDFFEGFVYCFIQWLILYNFNVFIRPVGDQSQYFRRTIVIVFLPFEEFLAIRAIHKTMQATIC